MRAIKGKGTVGSDEGEGKGKGEGEGEGEGVGWGRRRQRDARILTRFNRLLLLLVWSNE